MKDRCRPVADLQDGTVCSGGLGTGRLVGGRALGTLSPGGNNPIWVLTGWLPFTSGRQMSSSLQDPAYQDLVRHLAELRRGAGVTQSALADRLAKPQSWVSKSERFERRIDVLEFAQVVEALGRDPVAEFAAVVRKRG